MKIRWGIGLVGLGVGVGLLGGRLLWMSFSRGRAASPAAVSKTRNAVPTAQSLNRQASYTPSPEDTSPEGFDWVHRKFALIVSGMIYEHGFKGIVRKDVLAHRRDQLMEYLTEVRAISEETLDRWSEPHQIAFLLNAHHASLLLAMAGDEKERTPAQIELFGKKHSREELVNTVILKRFDDPRIVLSLACPEKGCPEFRNRVYNYKNVENQLSVNTVRFVRDPEKTRFDYERRVVEVSPYLKPYEALFRKRAGSLTAFFRKYVTDKDALSLLSHPEVRITFSKD